jgi:phosphoglycerate kinase
MVKKFQQRAVGRLVEREVSFLGKLLKEPQKPFLVILGGAKVSDKIGVIENLMNFADEFIIGGGMAYTFLKAQGVNIGKSLVEDLKLAQAKKILERAKNKGVKIHLPVDSLVAKAFAADSPYMTCKNGEDWGDGMALDIGPEATKEFAATVARARTLFWNGPLGVYEMPVFQVGTLAIAREVAKSSAMTVVGGGDSLAAIQNSGVGDKISHLSTGGGASLEFLEGKDLPGLKVLV